MKFFVILLLAIGLPAFAWATPFLVCDPYVPPVVLPTYFEVVMDGGSPAQSTPQDVTGGGKRLYHDVGSVSTGNHTVSVKACNEWGCSSAVNFSFSRNAPANPASIKLER